MILEDERILPKISELAVIGLQGHKVTQNEVELAKSHLGERLKLIYLEKDIRKAQLEEDQKTKGGQALKRILDTSSSGSLIC